MRAKSAGFPNPSLESRAKTWQHIPLELVVQNFYKLPRSDEMRFPKILPNPQKRYLPVIHHKFLYPENTKYLSPTILGAQAALNEFLPQDS
ncbi:hypothetical protein BLM37_01480 [Candidatus Gracilibacteria bacterium GN02-873]|nr:hypothetical protein BLM37_01480 [Candidatus Gracilibacteria bacterium GN02-873]